MMTNHEYLGNDMIEAGNEFGPDTQYGSSLIRVGQAEKRWVNFGGGGGGGDLMGTSLDKLQIFICMDWTLLA